MYSQIIASDEPWPSGTPDVKEYQFNCIHPRSTSPFFKIKYVDYPGGVLRGVGEYQDLDVVNRIQQADTILIVLDGMKIKRAMGRANDVATDHSIESDIATLMPYLNLCIGRNKPVHMLITKADILRPISDYSLGKIRALLFEDESLRSVVRQLTQRAPLRLIPISSVGTNFVHFNATGNAMEKRAGVRIQPINIELA